MSSISIHTSVESKVPNSWTTWSSRFVVIGPWTSKATRALSQLPLAPQHRKHLLVRLRQRRAVESVNPRILHALEISVFGALYQAVSRRNPFWHWVSVAFASYNSSAGRNSSVKIECCCNFCVFWIRNSFWRVRSCGVWIFDVQIFYVFENFFVVKLQN